MTLIITLKETTKWREVECRFNIIDKLNDRQCVIATPENREDYAEAVKLTNLFSCVTQGLLPINRRLPSDCITVRSLK